MVASGSDQTVRLWDVRDGICCQTLQGHNELGLLSQFAPMDNRVQP